MNTLGVGAYRISLGFLLESSKEIIFFLAY